MDSLWIDSMECNYNFEKLNTNLECDICIIGAGIFGITCAYYLSDLGYNVIVLDKHKIGHGVTGYTTGKITSQHSLFYKYLIKSYGQKFAKDYLEANEQSILNIKSIIDKEKINCDFEFQNNFIYTTKKSELQKIKEEVAAVESLGFNCEYTTKIGLPFDIEGAICFKNQAQFNSLKYLYGLCDSMHNKNCSIFENSTVIDVRSDNDNYITYTKNNFVKSKYVIVAAHYPFLNIPGFYFSKMYQSTSYAIAIDTKKSLFNGMYLSVEQPVLSFRTALYNNKKILIIAGADHKSGQPSSYLNTYGFLENEAKKLYSDCDVLFRWNTEDCISLDKIPYIGLFSNTTPNMYVGTGFKKWGMTSSNIAANIIVDNIQKNNNKYAYLFDSTRINPIKNADEMKNIVVQSSKSLLIDKLKKCNFEFSDIKLNSGGIVSINNQKVGIYKDTSGNVFAIKPFCTHLGCLLSWNDIEKTWDCPCHGSRFDFMGNNLYDPAIKSLEKYNLNS